ncbi:MAG TPA: DUF819 family protein [Gemmatimonadota bacterium]|nr:DUF819 family protein [Gemmatimonadota bacterium]
MIHSPLALAAVIALVTALAFWLDRHVPVLSRVGASLMVIVFGALLANFGIVAPSAPIYDTIAGPVTSLAIAWLLLGVHVRDLKEAGPRMLGAFGLAVLGTIVGVAIGTATFRSVFGDQTWQLAGAFTGTYTGGSLNFVAVGRGLGMPDTLFAGATAADALTTGIWMAACLLLPIWLARLYPFVIPGLERPAEAAAGGAAGAAAGQARPAPEAAGSAEDAPIPAAGVADEDHPFFSSAPISALGLAELMAAGLVLLVLSHLAGRIVPAVPDVLWLTTFALLAGHFGPLSRLEGTMQLGNYTLHLFFAVIGIYSQIGQILAVGVAVFLFTLLVVGVHGVIVFGLGRLFRIDVGSLAVASQAAVGGPTSALAVAVSREWPALVLPGIVVGLLGYAVGNYLGFGVAWLLHGVLG